MAAGAVLLAIATCVAGYRAGHRQADAADCATKASNLYTPSGATSLFVTLTEPGYAEVGVRNADGSGWLILTKLSSGFLSGSCTFSSTVPMTSFELDQIRRAAGPEIEASLPFD